MSTATHPAMDAMTPPALSKNTLVVTLILFSGISACAQGVTGAAGILSALVEGFANNKVLWLCLGIAGWHLLRSPKLELRSDQLAAALPSLTLGATAGGIWPWVGLWLSLVYLLLSDRSDRGPVRLGILIALAVASHEITINLVSETSGDALLAMDAWFAGSLANLFQPTVIMGNALQTADGHLLLLVWGCSSLSNLGDALLLFCALASIGAPTAPWAGRRFISYMIMLAVIAVALNATRLILMAGSEEAYAYLHSGLGAAWFRLATLFITAVLSSMVWN